MGHRRRSRSAGGGDGRDGEAQHTLSNLSAAEVEALLELLAEQDTGQSRSRFSLFGLVGSLVHAVVSVTLGVLGLGGGGGVRGDARSDSATEASEDEDEAAPGLSTPHGLPWERAFALLNLEVEASTSASVTRAFRRLSITCHPDKNADPDARKRFEQLCSARDEALRYLEEREETEPAAPSDSFDADAAADAVERQLEAEEAMLIEEAAFAAEAEKANARRAEAYEAWSARVAARAAELNVHRGGIGRQLSGNSSLRSYDSWQAGGLLGEAERAEGAPPRGDEGGSLTDFYGVAAHPAAIACRARTQTILQSLIVLSGMESGTELPLLAEDLGRGTTLLHHAAVADWREGIELILRFAGPEYGKLVTERDAEGATPADRAARAGASEGVRNRLRQLQRHMAALERGKVLGRLRAGVGAVVRVALIYAGVKAVIDLRRGDDEDERLRERRRTRRWFEAKA